MPFAVRGRHLHKAGQARLLFDGSIGGPRPDTRSGKEGRSGSRAFPVRNLRRVKRIADVVDARAGAPRAASGQRRVGRTVESASFGGIVEDPIADFRRLGEESRAIGRI